MRRRTGLLDHPLVGNQTGTVFGPSSASCRCCHTAASCQSAPSPAGHPGPKPLLVRQELPRDSRVQHEQDGAQHLAVIQPLAARDLTLLKKIARVRHIRDRLARASSVLLALFCRCDTRSHLARGLADWRADYVGRVVPGACSRPGPALSCAAGNGGVRSTGESPRVSRPIRGATGQGQTGRVNCVNPR